MIYFNSEIKARKVNGIWDFTKDISEFNKVTVPILYNENGCQKVFVGMDIANKYFDSAFFPVRIQGFYDKGRKYFYTTGYISQEKIFLPNNTLEVIVQYILPIFDIEPLDKNAYGNNLKSKLAMYGYNVRKGELTEEQRRNIIDFVIEYRFMKPIDIKNLLEHHVSFIHNRFAQNKWKRDIEYVRGKYMDI